MSPARASISALSRGTEAGKDIKTFLRKKHLEHNAAFHLCSQESFAYIVAVDTGGRLLDTAPAPIIFHCLDVTYLLLKPPAHISLIEFFRLCLIHEIDLMPANP